MIWQKLGGVELKVQFKQKQRIEFYKALDEMYYAAEN
jgi:hypothetical protein